MRERNLNVVQFFPRLVVHLLLLHRRIVRKHIFNMSPNTSFQVQNTTQYVVCITTHLSTTKRRLCYEKFFIAFTTSCHSLKPGAQWCTSRLWLSFWGVSSTMIYIAVMEIDWLNDVNWTYLSNSIPCTKMTIACYKCTSVRRAWQLQTRFSLITHASIRSVAWRPLFSTHV